VIRITKFLFLFKSKRKSSRQKVLTDSRSSEVAVRHQRFKEEIQKSLLGPWAVINPLKALFPFPTCALSPVSSKHGLTFKALF